jgi:hypothetical protein
MTILSLGKYNLIFNAMRLKSDLTLGLCYTLQIWTQSHTPPADASLILSVESVFVAVLLSQFKEWNLRGKIDATHLVEGR